MKETSYGIIPYRFINSYKEVEILLSKSSKNSNYGFIKGKIENNETPKQCAIRETFEEINLKINSSKLEELVFYKTPSKNIGLFFVNLNNININFEKNREIYSIEWINIKNITNIKISKNQQKFINNILQRFFLFK